jgi:hypothetical protein
MIRCYMAMIVGVLLAGCTTGGTKMTSNWKQPDYHVTVGERWVVLARVDEPGTRRAMEDQTVQRLRSSGVQASAAYLALPQMPMEASDYREQVKSAGFGAVVLYAPGASYTDIANRPGLGAGVGIGPVGVGVGPLIGGAKAEERRGINVQILPTSSAQPVWSAQYDVNLSEGIAKAMADVPQRAVDQMKTDHVW